MSESGKVQRGSKQRPRKEYPYYKIQVWEDRLVAWQDLPKAHQTMADAQDFVAQECKGKKARIVIVKGDRDRQPLE